MPDKENNNYFAETWPVNENKTKGSTLANETIEYFKKFFNK